jgi:hypothetical protein
MLRYPGKYVRGRAFEKSDIFNVFVVVIDLDGRFVDKAELPGQEAAAQSPTVLRPRLRGDCDGGERTDGAEAK